MTPAPFPCCGFTFAGMVSAGMFVIYKQGEKLQDTFCGWSGLHTGVLRLDDPDTVSGLHRMLKEVRTR